MILSNGNLHYFWDLERGNPYLITSFPTPDSVIGYQQVTPNPQRLVEDQVGDDYIVLTQRPNYQSEAAWRNEAERPGYIQANKLRFLRPYQLKAIHALQRAVKDGKDRFLFEMATGTGKTLAAAAVIKLFLRSGNARRVLFLVDRLELEEQARKAFVASLSADFQTVIYKENRDDWRRAEIVVTTVQSLLFNNKYQRLFSPTDFDLVISDEAHRSIGGNARAVFDYFIGYKLGLTATPRDYLKRFDKASPSTRDPREAERRLLLDTYRTFGCENSQPTYRYSLLDGVKDGFLINPMVVDARTEITTELLSEEGFVVSFHRRYRRRSAGDIQTARVREALLRRRHQPAFLQDLPGKRPARSGQRARSASPSSSRSARITPPSWRRSSTRWPTACSPASTSPTSPCRSPRRLPDAQQFTINFTNNNLLGSANFLPAYKTSKARICVTVGMMTTGYDCTDILNLGLFRPIFSPTDFIQIKGRGTRKHNFLEQLFDDSLKDGVAQPQKSAYKLFDFFANCEYFEEEFNYDEVLKLPRPPEQGPRGRWRNTGPVGGRQHL